jgi:histidinol dehydrogenase
MKTYIWNNLTKEQQQQILARPSVINQEELVATVKNTLQQVKQNGDLALIELTKKFDKVKTINRLKEPSDKTQFFKTTKKETQQALAQIDTKNWQAIQFAYQQIKKYHQAQLEKNITVNMQPGVTLSRQSRPIPKVGLYIPGGSAPLVSTVLMLGVPAQIAGNPLKIICTPPNQDNQINPYILAAAELCGIDSIFKIGGAQAIAAMAYGTNSIPQVNKIFGPGNRFVTIAKQLIAQENCQTTIDMPAGPSEVLVIADNNANPQYVAADLLSQAEHGPDSQVICVSTDSNLATDIINEIQQQLLTLSRRQIAEQALSNSRMLIVNNSEQAIDISNRYAPEHLILNINKAEKYLNSVTAAGSVFVGAYAPETIGDYVSGSNHVLPTAGYASSVSGLNVGDFMLKINFQKIDQSGLQAIGPYAATLAKLEGLTAHANAVEYRLINNEVVNEY